jgi:hypothetical protein
MQNNSLAFSQGSSTYKGVVVATEGIKVEVDKSQLFSKGDLQNEK